MTYVPTQYSGGQRPSPRARELAQRIEQTLQEFMSNYPDTKPRDIQQALRMAWGSSDPTIRSKRALALSLVAGIFVAVGLLVFFAEGGGEVAGPFPLIAVISVVVLALGLFAVVKNR